MKKNFCTIIQRDVVRVPRYPGCRWYLNYQSFAHVSQIWAPTSIETNHGHIRRSIDKSNKSTISCWTIDDTRCYNKNSLLLSVCSMTRPCSQSLTLNRKNGVIGEDRSDRRCWTLHQNRLHQIRWFWTDEKCNAPLFRRYTCVIDSGHAQTMRSNLARLRRPFYLHLINT